MADKWMDEREREWRERSGRRTARYGRDPYGFNRPDEARSWGEDEGHGEPGGYRGQGRVFGERETGVSYGRPAGPSGGYGPRGGYDAYRGRAARYGRQDYSQGGRYYGDDDTQRIYREEYGQGGVEYGEVPRGYGGRPYDGPRGYRGRPAYGDTTQGGTGGYDYDRGYGDAGRRYDNDRDDGPGDFLQRAGERVASWFRGDDHPRDAGYARGERDHRGRGPKGYKRSDERIDDEAHQRLTDDSWLDASEISISVSGGEVTLSGTVESREAKHRAERLVEDVTGVVHVQNNLRVDRGGFLTSAGRGFGDSAVEAQMRRDDPAANGSGGAGGGQSSAGRKSS